MRTRRRDCRRLYINDSKATNVGAAVSAMSGLATGKNIILIAGGEAKGQSFEALNKR